MANYSCDKDGVLLMRADDNTLKFSRVDSVNVSGWSALPGVKSLIKSATESTGKFVAFVSDHQYSDGTSTSSG